ncbi:sulfotransferase domain-containing protein [Kaustia mangrovi]|uniref:Sulfotransferase domain-containing protein n=1 Tax=Kaustia mangrovi TaxID=2593653 RepID=A0A7S8C4N6_9HYPH|nr:sulfotransferase domain-containing protein [Kaustia mangrovi]QPC43329.1 sulfotransferase domain-containing protein [Kaustia mangrovi]
MTNETLTDDRLPTRFDGGPRFRIRPNRFGREGIRAVREAWRFMRADAVFVSYPKSGRTWVRAMISRVYQRRYGLPDGLLLEFDDFHRRNAEIPRILFTHDGDASRKPEEFGHDRTRYASKKTVFLARNPLDVVVSRYYHARFRGHHFSYGHELDDFVWKPNGGLASIVSFLNAWHQARQSIDRFLLLRYEDFHARPVETLGRLMSFLGLEASEDELCEAVAFTAFEQLKEKEASGYYKSSRLRPRDPGNPDSFKVRSGKVGGYLESFPPDMIRRMEDFVRSNLTDAYGYLRA